MGPKQNPLKKPMEISENVNKPTNLTTKTCMKFVDFIQNPHKIYFRANNAVEGVTSNMATFLDFLRRYSVKKS